MGQDKFERYSWDAQVNRSSVNVKFEPAGLYVSNCVMKEEAILLKRL